MEFFNDRTTNGESTDEALAGEYTVFISGVFNGASIKMLVQSADGGNYILAKSVKTPSTFNIKVVGNVKFELVEANLNGGDSTSISVYVNEL